VRSLQFLIILWGNFEATCVPLRGILPSQSERGSTRAWPTPTATTATAPIATATATASAAAAAVSAAAATAAAASVARVAAH
jgi:hypothetical protein